jgi:FMN phosphatase YigB (HAD superfamily)
MEMPVGLIAAAVSSSEHGYLKPHPSIFEAASKLAGAEAEQSVMVGDSLAHPLRA